jgi:Family of unknown function (DUF5988)
MKDNIIATSSTTSMLAVLEGGPNSIPVVSRVQPVNLYEEKIKLQHHGGYEHFERTGELDEGDPLKRITFRWTMRTKIAE